VHTGAASSTRLEQIIEGRDEALVFADLMLGLSHGSGDLVPAQGPADSDVVLVKYGLQFEPGSRMSSRRCREQRMTRNDEVSLHR
jgi:hypothetical protein